MHIGTGTRTGLTVTASGDFDTRQFEIKTGSGSFSLSADEFRDLSEVFIPPGTTVDYSTTAGHP